jgi:Tol biopolymer transport system component
MKTSFLGVALSLGLAICALSQIRETRAEVKILGADNAIGLQISPDGEKIVFAGLWEGKNSIWVHTLATGVTSRLPVAEQTGIPSLCWSPDSKSIAYFGDPSLKRIDLETNTVKVIAGGLTRGAGCSWGRDGTILFVAGASTMVGRVPEQGGAPQAATPRGTLTAYFPYFLPDGRHFIYYVVGEGVYLAELGGAGPKLLLPTDSAAVYSRTGHLLFVRGTTLYAQGFDAELLTLNGSAIKVADNVPVNIFRPSVSVSTAGDLLYRTGPAGGSRQFKWFDRNGKDLGNTGEPFAIAGSPPRLSPDERFILFDRSDGGRTDVWTIELATAKSARLTEIPGLNLFPTWSMDSCCIYFTSNQTGVFELYKRPATGTGKEELVIAAPRITRQAKDASADGRFLLYRRGDGEIWAVQMDGNPRGEFAIVENMGNADNPRFSPNGRWVVYQATTSGKTEVYVQPFPTGRRIAVSNGGGVHPQWRSDGKEIFYLNSDGKITAVTLEADADEQNARLGAPTPLFAPKLVGNQFSPNALPQWMVARDGRFLVATPAEVDSPITLIRNWQATP